MLPTVFHLDKLGGSFARFAEAVREGKYSAVFEATQNARYHLTGALGNFFLLITPDRISAKAARDVLADYTGGDVVLIPEKEDVLLNVQAYLSGALAEKMGALTKLHLGRARGAVISAEGLTQFFPKRELFAESLIALKKGEETAVDTLAERLARCGYRKEDIVAEAGSFSLRGDILDVWAVGSDLPVRVEFFGDTIESIRLFAPESMLSVRGIDEIIISPKSDIIIPQTLEEGILKRLISLKRTAGKRLQEIAGEMEEKLTLNASDPALQWLLPFMQEVLGTVFDYLPRDAVVAFDEIKAVDDKLKLYLNAHAVRVKSLAEAGEVSSAHKESLVTRERIYREAKDKILVAYQQLISSNPVFDPEAIFKLKALPAAKYSYNYPALVGDIRGMLQNGARIFLYTGNESAAASLKDYLNENDLAARISETGEDAGEILLIPKRIARGFIYPQAHLMIAGTDDLMRRTDAPKKTLNRKKREFLTPLKGDYVVHDLHGIGMSEGIVQVDTKDGKRDYYVVLYKGGDRLYLPVDQMDSLEKYTGGGAPALHKLGGKEFERIKERVRNSVKTLAIDLLSLYEKRLKKGGHVYQPDTVWQRELEESFPFTETDDQLTAIAEIKEDMESGKVMDRLLCGDVGFGKTEVAVRAIFKTIMEGKQAAILAPTTILCQQHFNTVSERFSQFGIQVDVLSRFVSHDYIKGALERIKSGKTSVVVATHRLLSKDVVFHDLGLLVLDEEQRFGVEHKEKIKVLKTNINVLALSATPIPRTLHMSLSGIRDISTLETPPANRLPVETYVLEYSDALLLDAARRELARGGQVFILYNQVRTIEKYYTHVQELLGSDASVIYAHGQMESYELEERIRAFYNKEANVLVATTIIENGIDLPDANTLIVVDADKLGLSALYQLKGRVGRSYNLAYAYFTVREGKVLTANAEKRLDALLSHTELGAGFKIAIEDMEIRGAGNVLGREQHGNMEKVGYDMYCRLLSESIGELKGVLPKPKREVEILADGDISLPKEYITDGSQRVKFYKEVAALATLEEETALLIRLTDVYGKPPVPVRCLATVGLIKNLAGALGVKKVTATGEGLALHFYDSGVFTNEKVFAALDTYKESAVLMPADPPMILFDNKNKTQAARLTLIKEFLLSAF